MIDVLFTMFLFSGFTALLVTRYSSFCGKCLEGEDRFIISNFCCGTIRNKIRANCKQLKGQVYMALTGLLVNAFKALINGEESLRQASEW